MHIVGIYTVSSTIFYY